MNSRLLLTAIFALAAFGLSVESRAAEGPAAHHAKAHRGVRHYHHRYYGGHYGYLGGHKYGETYSMPEFSDTNCYPGFYNCQSFWERVQTQRNYPVQY